MEYVISKRYMWSPYMSGKVPCGKSHMYINGILNAIDKYGNGILISRQNEEWIVPLDNLVSWKK